MFSPEEKAEIEEEIGGSLIADVGEEIEALKGFAEKVLELKEGEDIPDEMVQEAITALTRIYTVKFQVGERWSPFGEQSPVPATAAMIMCTAMLKSVNVEIFELGLWQSWSGA